jgi:hypothetical protein
MQIELNRIENKQDAEICAKNENILLVHALENNPLKTKSTLVPLLQISIFTMDLQLTALRMFLYRYTI